MRDGSWKKMQKGWLHPRVDTITLHRVLHSEEEKICVYIYIFFVCIYIYIHRYNAPTLILGFVG